MNKFRTALDMLALNPSRGGRLARIFDPMHLESLWHVN